MWYVSNFVEIDLREYLLNYIYNLENLIKFLVEGVDRFPIIVYIIGVSTRQPLVVLLGN